MLHIPGIAQLKIVIEGIDPPIWRRLLVPRETLLGDLHHMIQSAFGWWDYHLHEFEIGGLRYGDAELLEDGAFEEDPRVFDETGVRLYDFAPDAPPFLYRYDFGDDWHHYVEIEKLLMREKDCKYPACIEGARSRPPEDVGGVGGYAEFLEAFHDPEHEDHHDMRRWAGRGFHPEKFDLEKTNKDVRLAVRRAQRRRNEGW
ncbi:hypothetical protein CKO28_14600 [Rhodovibrio sodomensis]|uniref:Plasmid pRiA4b Orf3-like domain-containing protein n=1 Tax=Rhodovibrio sodomensis TaxID=1088 RepID=A0ABS1DFL4_9PROT|nr:plasmid pRiA4b ORF-3 family protein [Rhodovibrio sodomensis]MBK1669264.1 hypothetical protein [Rhodovibrio sodomensis]